MKKIIFSLTLLLFVIKSFGQTATSSTLSKDYYFKKSKTQKTIGWIMLGGGVAMTTIGLLILNNHTNDDPFVGFDYILSNKSEGPTILFIAGIGTALGSIPFFISSAKNRRRAATVSFSTSKAFITAAKYFCF